jgi:hypothetical protein
VIVYQEALSDLNCRLFGLRGARKSPSFEPVAHAFGHFALHPVSVSDAENSTGHNAREVLEPTGFEGE